MDVTGISTVTDTVFAYLENDNADRLLDKTSAISHVPSELISEIASYMDNPNDIANMRLAGRRFCNAVRPSFLKAMVDDRTIYPRYEGFRSFLAILGMRANEFGYMWAWENIRNLEDLEFEDKDCAVIVKVNRAHADDIALNGPFVNGGGYRSMLTALLGCLPNLQTIEIRKLKPGEHNPGWDGPELLKQLSFYHDDLNTNDIFYGDWQYDTVLNRVTVYKDEFGDEIAEPGAGPQASFIDDLKGAVETSGTKAKLAFLV